MKKVVFNLMSDTLCATSKCNNQVKANVANRRQMPAVCRTCFIAAEAGRGHFVDSKPRGDRVAAGLPVKKYS